MELRLILPSLLLLLMTAESSYGQSQDPCSSVDCHNGTCRVSAGRPVCDCVDGYRGARCLLPAPADTGECGEGRMTCDVRGVSRCLNDFRLCDGRQDCDSGADEDEQYCVSHTCTAGYLKCENNVECYKKERQCDGFKDCNDLSDESMALCATCDVSTDTRGDHGVLTSPGYPDHHPPHQHCTWTLSAPAGRAVRLTIQDIDLQRDGACLDYVQVTGSDRLCGRPGEPAVLTSSGDVMEVTFVADVFYHSRGFNATWDTVLAGTPAPATWGEWSAWGVCSSTCRGTSVKTRSRNCTAAVCDGEDRQWEACDVPPCDLPHGHPCTDRRECGPAMRCEDGRCTCTRATQYSFTDKQCVSIHAQCESRPGEFYCPVGGVGQCLLAYHVCDGVPVCDDLSDEADCDQPETPTLSLLDESPSDLDPVTFICDSRSDRVTSYQFFKDGRLLQDTPSATYRITHATHSLHGGGYTCTVERLTVRSNHSRTEVLVLTPQTPTLNPDPAPSALDVLESGTGLDLTCDTRSVSRDLTFQFFKNGNEVGPRQRSAVMTLTPKTEDSGTWTCAAVVAAASLPSNGLTITVVDKPARPRLTLTSSITRAVDQENLVLTCTTTSQGISNYEFFKDGVSLGDTGSNLLIRSPASLGVDDGNYTCTANVKGIASDHSPALNVVLAPQTPTLDVIPTVEYIESGNSLTFKCHTSSSGIVTYKFIQHNVGEVTQTSPTYTVTADLSHTGIWSCSVVINSVESDPSADKIVVVTPHTPTLTVSPPDAAIESGKSLLLKCDTNSSGSATYKFMKDNNFVASSTSEYRVTADPTSHSGVWSCSVTINSVESDSSAGKIVLVVDKPNQPSLTSSPTRPVDQEDLVMTCTTTSPEISYYEFFIDGVSLGVVGSNQLKRSPAQIGDDDGNYTCTATVLGIASDHSPVLRVALAPQTPTLDVIPAVEFIESGNSLTFKCHTSSSGIVTYKFIQHNVGEVTQTSPTYTVTADLSHTGIWSCSVVINSVESDPSADKIVVVTPHTPSLTVSPPDAAIESGKSLSLKCETNSSGSATYKFMKDNNFVASSTSEYRVTADPTSHSGVWSCSVTINSVESDSSAGKIVLVVDKPNQPSLTSSPTRPIDQEDLVLTCTTTTPGISNYEFFIDGESLGASGSNQLKRSPAWIGIDDGNYTCTATVLGITSDRSPHLRVTLKPQTPGLTVRPPALTFESGMSLTFECHTSSAGPKTYTFFQNNVNVKTQTSGTYTVTADTSHSGLWSCSVVMNSVESDQNVPIKILVADPTTTAPATWTMWSPWSACSATCGRGERSRVRSCDGSGCEGEAEEQEYCLADVLCADHGWQLEPRDPRESLGNATYDDWWQTQAVQVPAPVDRDQLREDLHREDMIFHGKDFDELSLFVEPIWTRPLISLKSCPRSQKYACHSMYYRLPCTRQFVQGAMRTCCPVHPSKVVNYAARCNCCKCSILSESGAQCGSCHRRYTFHTVTSYCHGPHSSSDSSLQWQLMRHTMHVPTSCYCRAGC